MEIFLASKQQLLASPVICSHSSLGSRTAGLSLALCAALCFIFSKRKLGPNTLSLLPLSRAVPHCPHPSAQLSHTEQDIFSVLRHADLLPENPPPRPFAGILGAAEPSLPAPGSSCGQGLHSKCPGHWLGTGPARGSHPAYAPGVALSSNLPSDSGSDTDLSLGTPSLIHRQAENFSQSK